MDGVHFCTKHAQFHIWERSIYVALKPGVLQARAQCEWYHIWKASHHIWNKRALERTCGRMVPANYYIWKSVISRRPHLIG